MHRRALLFPQTLLLLAPAHAPRPLPIQNFPSSPTESPRSYHTSGDYSPDTPALPADYEAVAKQVAPKQIVLAGYGMAGVLNEVLGSSRRDSSPPPVSQ
jgi:hypothetical protein